MQTIILFTTAGCHLCEQAHELLSLYQSKVRVQEYDIACDEAAIERYGLRIPVLRNHDSIELDWPFDQRQLQVFIEHGLVE